MAAIKSGPREVEGGSGKCAPGESAVSQTLQKLARMA